MNCRIIYCLLFLLISPPVFASLYHVMGAEINYEGTGVYYKQLVIFPEGTSSDGNRVLPFKSSLFNIFEKNLNSKILVQTITIVYKKINGIPMNRIERKNITWHSNMDLIPNMLNVLKKLSIEVEIIFNEEFLPNKEHDRKKLALHCWEKINYNLTNSLYRK